MRPHGADLEDGIKFACHHSGVFATAETVDRTPSAPDVEAIQADVARYLPEVDPVPVQSAVCCYTNTPDGHFIVDRHPGDDRVVLVSACSGHGFKFSPVLGAIAADLVDGQRPAFDPSPFAVTRLGRLER
jgi:sarcosine oxidase